mgnify:FL=1
MQSIKIFTTTFIIVVFSCSQLISGEYNPLQVHTFHLDNGLTVYLNEDHNTTSVFGAVAVRGGGKRDPQDATGIAHYLEHLLFKGTDKMGTVDYEQEKVFLDSIQVKYDELGATTDETKRLAIQGEINRLSVKAGEFAIPNEFDRLVEGMGGAWINAFTSDDAIVYLNKFPGNQIEKWLEVYSHRFVNPVFRLFQSELETVYEEKNRAMDNMFRNLFVTYLKHFFKEHPYGQQTVLGSVDHLKNPSLTKMREYYDTYYVANNMALILTGDIYPDEILPLIEAKFGVWKSGEIPAPIDITEQSFNGREKISRRMTPIKVGFMGYRTVPVGHDDEGALSLSLQLLTNESKTGLIDQLVVDRKIMEAGAFNMDYVDMGAANFYFLPKLFFQSLTKAENLVRGQIDKLKSGDFNDEYFNAVKLTMLRQHEEYIESMEGRLFILTDLFIKNKTWEDIVEWPGIIKNISKEEVMEVANTYFDDDYLVLHSKMGFPKKTKLEKPSFEPVIPKNSEEKSAFAANLDNIPEGELNLQFIEFNKDVEYRDISHNVHLYHTYNPINSIFSLTIQYGIGNFKDAKLEQTAELLNLLGTDTYSFNQFKGALQKIGTTISFSSDRDYFKINVKGFDEHLNKSLEYVNEFITHVKGDDDKIKKLVESAKSGRKIEKREPSTVGRALRDFVAYGDQSHSLRRMTVKEIKNTKSIDYIQAFKNALNYELDIFYTGKLSFDSVAASIQKSIPLSDNPIDSQSPHDLEVDNWDEDAVFLVKDKKVVQSQIYFLVNGNPVVESDRPKSNAYNKYFGRGMSSIIFQEIREFRSLAYSAGGGYRTNFYNNKKGYFSGYVGCQADKSLEAISVFKDLALNMPEKPERLEQIKSGLIKSINANRPSFRSFPSRVSNWIKQGYMDDPRKEQVSFYENMSFDDIVNFQKDNIAGRPMVITLLTDTKQVNTIELSQFGKVIMLKKKDILN